MPQRQPVTDPAAYAAMREAILAARSNAAAAAAVEANLTTQFAREARTLGHSIRDIAVELGISHSAVFRILHGNSPVVGPLVAPEGYVAAYNAAFTHAPQHHITQAPFTRHVDPDTGDITITLVPLGYARPAE